MFKQAEDYSEMDDLPVRSSSLSTQHQPTSKHQRSLDISELTSDEYVHRHPILNPSMPSHAQHSIGILNLASKNSDDETAALSGAEYPTCGTTLSRQANIKKIKHKKSTSAFSFDSIHQKASAFFSRKLQGDSTSSDTDGHWAAVSSSGGPGKEISSTGSAFVQNEIVEDERRWNLRCNITEEIFPDLQLLIQSDRHVFSGPLVDSICYLLDDRSHSKHNLNDSVSQGNIMNDDELILYQNELFRIKDQIEVLTQEYEKEIKLKNSSLDMIKTYTPSLRDTHSHQATLHSSSNSEPSRKSMHRKKRMNGSGSSEWEIPSFGTSLSEIPIKPSTSASNDFASHIVTILNSLVQLYARQQTLNGKISKYVSAKLLDGYAHNVREEMDRKLEVKRSEMMQRKSAVKETKEKHHILDSWHVILRDELMRTLCEEIVTINGYTNRIRTEKMSRE